MKSLNSNHFLLIILSISLLTACKKDKDENTGTSETVSAADKVKDTTLLYAQEAYLWNTQIPTNFNARSYKDPNAIMEAIRKYSQEPGFTSSVDRWSFAMDQKSWDNISSGVSGDFGLTVYFRPQTEDLRVAAVEKNSPAGMAGVQRGWRITKVNGSSSTVSTSNATALQNAIYNSNSTSFTFQKPDNSTVDIVLNARSYQENPIFLDSVYNTSAGKLGYLVFNSFLGDTTQIYNEFSRIFNRFASAGVNDVVVDLRYNGGGYVTMQQKLANYLVKSSSNGQLMMKQEFNNKLARYNSITNFNKLGSLNASRIFFIVGRNTASASELLINNLQPHMDVRIVGSSKTYGKPVGYFPIEVGSWYTFPVSFRSTNKNGQGNYFDGIALNHQSNDGLDKGWGDVDEALFGSIIRFINTGSFGRFGGQALDGNQSSERTRKANETIDRPSFNGMIDTRRMH